MLSDLWLRIGAIAFVLGAVCCFTPLAVGALGMLGLAAYAIWIDVVAMPLFLIGMGIIVASLIRIRQSKV